MRRAAPIPDDTRRCRVFSDSSAPKRQFLAYCLYRWEIILRESASFAILEVTTLGFCVDAAISEFHLDVDLRSAVLRAAVCLSI